jgi:hypothetical protein
MCVGTVLFIFTCHNTLLFYSTYEGWELLDALAPTLCPAFFPPGQECSLPLNPGPYGSHVGGTLDITLPEIPDIIGRPQAHILALS